MDPLHTMAHAAEAWTASAIDEIAFLATWALCLVLAAAVVSVLALLALLLVETHRQAGERRQTAPPNPAQVRRTVPTSPPSGQISLRLN